MDEMSDQGYEDGPRGNDPTSMGTPAFTQGVTPPEGMPRPMPMPLSMPPFGPELPSGHLGAVGQDPVSDPTLDEVRAVGPDPRIPGTALPGAGGAPPSGGQPPYLPPYGYGWSPGGLPPQGGGGQPPNSSSRNHRAFAALGVVALLAGGLGAGLGIAFAGTGNATGAPSGSSSVSTPPSSSGGGSLSSTGASASVSAIASSVEPSVVDIRTTVASPEGESEAAAGTGMIITPSGEVLTNNHVVENAMTIRVNIAGRSGSYPAKVLAVNPTKDVALLKIEGVSNLPTTDLGNSSTVTVGSPVVAVGNALGLGGTPTVVSGQVSALGRTINATDPGLTSETLHGMIQTTAPIEPGDSGGPLLSTSDKVIGMDTAAETTDTGATVGFSIPINEARTIVREMQHHDAVGGIILGESPFLGVYELESGSASSSPGLGSPFSGLPGSGTSGTTTTVSGVTIGGVVGSSPAERSGLQGGDVITSIDGQSTPSWTALEKAIESKKAGEAVTVSYVGAGGTAQTATITLAALPK